MTNEAQATATDEARVYELINPSDPYTLVASSRRTAAAAALLLGSGAYAVKEVGGDWDMPLFVALGEQAGDELEAWWRDEFEEDPPETFTGRAEQVADVLDTVMISGTDRDPDKMPDPEEHDERRTSMNDIGAAAWRLADRLREAAAE